jgi:hypothetical protein
VKLSIHVTLFMRPAASKLSGYHCVEGREQGEPGGGACGVKRGASARV